GDFNDWRNTLGKGPFRRHGFTHATAPAVRFRSFPASMPVAALDKLFHRGGITIERIHLPRTKLTLRASDHLPLVVDFTLTNGQAEPNR
ncbi:MAG TPA: hypothetical protein VFT74_19730, partial [Isosphaeraceae bacterium]|nr:hypothetical protein [Isosphaeraceae bacterium]